MLSSSKAAFLKGLTGGFRDDLVCLVGGRTDSGLCDVSVWSDLASLRCWLCPEAFFKLSCSSQSSSLSSSEMKLLLATVPPDRQSPSYIIPGPSMLFGQLSVGCSSPKGSFVNIISGKVCTLAWFLLASKMFSAEGFGEFKRVVVVCDISRIAVSGKTFGKTSWIGVSRLKTI